MDDEKFYTDADPFEDDDFITEEEWQDFWEEVDHLPADLRAMISTATHPSNYNEEPY